MATQYSRRQAARDLAEGKGRWLFTGSRDCRVTLADFPAWPLIVTKVIPDRMKRRHRPISPAPHDRNADNALALRIDRLPTRLEREVKELDFNAGERILPAIECLRIV